MKEVLRKIIILLTFCCVIIVAPAFCDYNVYEQSSIPMNKQVYPAAQTYGYIHLIGYDTVNVSKIVIQKDTPGQAITSNAGTVTDKDGYCQIVGTGGTLNGLLTTDGSTYFEIEFDSPIPHTTAGWDNDFLLRFRDSGSYYDCYVSEKTSGSKVWGPTASSGYTATSSLEATDGSDLGGYTIKVYGDTPVPALDLDITPTSPTMNDTISFTQTCNYAGYHYGWILRFNGGEFSDSYYDYFWNTTPGLSVTWPSITLPAGDYQFYSYWNADGMTFEGNDTFLYTNFTVIDPLWTPTLNSTYDWRNATNITEFSPEDWNFEIGLNRTEIEDMVNSSVIPEAIISSVFDMWDSLLDPLVSGLTAILNIVNYPLTMITQVFDDFENQMNTYDGVFSSYLGFWIQVFRMIFSVMPDALEAVLCGGLVLMGTKIILER